MIDTAGAFLISIAGKEIVAAGITLGFKLCDALPIAALQADRFAAIHHPIDEDRGKKDEEKQTGDLIFGTIGRRCVADRRCHIVHIETAGRRHRQLMVTMQALLGVGWIILPARWTWN